MCINAKIQLTILASAFALAAAAPAAFAQGSGTRYQGFHADSGATANAPAGRHGKDVMEKTIAPGGMASGVATEFGVPAF